jgi:UDP-N-acetylglucosamine 2-epimerase (non-hydrolysing)
MSNANKPKPIMVVYGTSAELIKLWPLILDLDGKADLYLTCSNQQPDELRKVESIFQIDEVVHLRDPNKPNLTTRRSVLPWAFGVLLHGLRLVRRIKSQSDSKEKILVVVHGDTMTSLIGALIGRIHRQKVAHVEAGLRSHNWKHPFPEELIRRLLGYLSDYHFAPSQTAVENLRDPSRHIVNTHGNTSLDTMRIVKGKNFTRTDGDFLLVSLHRSELLSNALVLRQTVSEIILSTNFLPVTIVLDSLTLKALKSEDLIDDLLQSEVTVLQKLPYPDFISLLFRVKLVVTDSGGLQEECAALSIPCLVHRMHTEREDGLGQCVSLSRWVPTAIVEFVEHQMKEAMVPQSEIGISANSPTQIIVKELEKLGFLK